MVYPYHTNGWPFNDPNMKLIGWAYSSDINYIWKIHLEHMKPEKCTDSFIENDYSGEWYDNILVLKREHITEIWRRVKMSEWDLLQKIRNNPSVSFTNISYFKDGSAKITYYIDKEYFEIGQTFIEAAEKVVKALDSLEEDVKVKDFIDNLVPDYNITIKLDHYMLERNFLNKVKDKLINDKRFVKLQGNNWLALENGVERE